MYKDKSLFAIKDIWLDEVHYPVAEILKYTKEISDPNAKFLNSMGNVLSIYTGKADDWPMLVP